MFKNTEQRYVRLKKPTDTGESRKIEGHLQSRIKQESSMTAGGEKSFFDGDKQLETITWQLDEIHGKNNYNPIFVFLFLHGVFWTTKIK